MKNLFIPFIIIIASCSSTEEPVQAEDSLILYNTEKSVEEAVSTLKDIMHKKGFTLFAEIDHAENARQADMALDPNVVLIFGKPEAGTKLLQCDRRMGVELPLRLLIFRGNDNKTHIGYWAMGGYAEYYELKDCEQLLENINNALKALVMKAVE